MEEGVGQGACESLAEEGMRDGECIYECDSVGYDKTRVDMYRCSSIQPEFSLCTE